MRQYLVLKADEKLRAAHRTRDFGLILRESFDALRAQRVPPDLLDNKLIEVAFAPSSDFVSTIVDDPDPLQVLPELLISYRFTSPKLIDRWRDFLGKLLLDKSGDVVKNFGADPFGHVCTLFPAAQAQTFGNRSRVREMMGIGDLQARGLKGKGVNVAIIDQGLNKDEIEARYPGRWGGGLAPVNAIEPGSAPRTSHGMMIARNILDIAPEAIVYDVPLIPLRIGRASVFASAADSIYRAVIAKIRTLRQTSGANQSWILVNAWAIFDRTGEYPLGDYTCNAHPKKEGSTEILWHPLNVTVKSAVDDGIDVVFGSGNCGQFTTSGRCGKHDRGAGSSIWGANAHPSVLTVGAVSGNANWLGYSSQGPAPWGASPKPDICIPSQFCEDKEPSVVNSGTSAPTGIAAGILAAIRGNQVADWGPVKLPFHTLKDAINATASGQRCIWNERTGHGMLDVRALLQRLDPPGA